MANEQIIEKKRIIDFTERSTITDDVYIATDDESIGTRKYQLNNILEGVPTAEDLDDKADIIITSASGSIAHITDAGAYPVEELEVGIEPVQDLHGYDNPWPAGGGKNLLPPGTTTTHQQVTFTVAENGAVTLSGTATANAALDIGRGTLTLPAGTYIASISGNGNATLEMYKLVGGSASFMQNNFTLTEETSVFLRLKVSSGTTASGTVYPQIETGSTATSWTPYSNLCPISGHTGCEVMRTGKNLLDPTKVQNGAISGVTGLPYVDNRRLYTDYIRINGKTFTTFNSAGMQTAVAYYNKNKDFILTNSWGNTPDTRTPPSDAEYVIFIYRLSTDANIIPSELTNPQCELGSTATPYEPYTSATYPISWQSSAGTVYGVTYDSKTGKLRVDSINENMGNLTWTKENNHFYSNVVSNAKPPVNNTVPANILSSMYMVKDAYSVTQETTNCTIGLNNSKRFYVYDSSYTDAAAFQSAMNGVQLVYELATPIEYDIDPATIELLLGTNNVWNTGGGDTDVTYKADTKLYIDGKILEAVTNALNS